MCSNATYKCSKTPISNYEYCELHILQDVNSPYVQCTYIYQNKKQCPHAVLVELSENLSPKTTLCFEHNRRLQLKKTRGLHGKFRSQETCETFLHNLTRHVKVEDMKQKVKHEVEDENEEEEIDVVSLQDEEFTIRNFTSDMTEVHVDAKADRSILEYASDSSTDVDVPCMENTKPFELDDSDDDEPTPLEGYNVLQHAEIFTPDEVLNMSASKLSRLRDLYKDQMKYLGRELKKVQKDYEDATMKEIQSGANPRMSPLPTTDDQKHYEQFRALKSYHRYHGVDAVLREKMNKKQRLMSEGNNDVNKNTIKCVFVDAGVKCTNSPLPLSKYCILHILYDQTQVLFRPCGEVQNAVKCQVPVLPLKINPKCDAHSNIPNVHKKEEQSDDDKPSCSTKTAHYF